MKIVHIALLSFYTEGYSYQDNILPKYHVKLGNEVTLITSKRCYNQGKIISTNETNYINCDGVKIIRLSSNVDSNFHKGNLASKFIRYKNLYNTIFEEKPDVLFIHGCQFLDIKIIVKYLKHNNVITYVDNHSDCFNSGKSFLSLNILHKHIWKHMAHLIEPYTKKFYGVLPIRVKWLIDIYKLPKEKCELLELGADNDLVSKIKKENCRNSINKQYKLNNDNFLIVAGGKIDSNKYQILTLMEVFNNINDKNLKLIIFGSVSDELKEKFDDLCKNSNIIYVGWIDNNMALKLFESANLVAFPGLHSVYWEQAVALGKPLLCKKIKDTNHIDLGGNVEYIDDDSLETLNHVLKKIIYNKNTYDNMKKNANKQEKNKFLYSEIAKKSLEIR